MNTKISYTPDGRLVLPHIECSCGCEHAEPKMDVYIGQDLLPRVPSMLQRKELGKHILLVSDNNTWEIAGKKLTGILTENGYTVDTCVVERDDEMDPDETAVGEVLLSMTKETELLISVGSGCVTDITRITATHTGRPFVAVGTAPSMDGYTSTVAPLLFRGLKINAPAICPEIIVCDLDIMRTAPMNMYLSGVGDVLGKYIASVDWKLGNIINDEPFCEACNALTITAADKLLANIDTIAERSVEGTRILIEALILAGLTIMVIGHTRAVASAEHNIAHFWDMEMLKAGVRPPRHGIAVGCATVLIWPIFEKFAELDPTGFDRDHAIASNMTVEERTAFMIDHYGKRSAEVIMKENPGDFLTEEEVGRRFDRIVTRFDEIKTAINGLPDKQKIADVIVKLGGTNVPAELGIDDQLVMRAIECAGDYRTRYTLMKTIREIGLDAKKLL